MSKIAVIKTGGKQYKVKKGDTVKVEKLDKKEGAKVTFDTLLVSETDGKGLKMGQPSLGKKVEGKVIEQARDKKVRVIKYKSKIRYQRNLGHRQPYTKVEITSII